LVQRRQEAGIVLAALIGTCGAAFLLQKRGPGFEGQPAQLIWAQIPKFSFDFSKTHFKVILCLLIRDGKCMAKAEKLKLEGAKAEKLKS
jgi:transcriptional regulator GlxA family with amidase domain